MNTLTKDEKIQIIESRLRGLEYKKYGLQVDLLMENAKSSPESESISKLNESIDEIDNQLSVLNSELTTVNALVE